MFRTISLLLVLFGTWLLLSGHYEPMILILGILSCILAVGLARRMDIVDREGHPVHLGWRAPIYWIWLGWEIAKANISVAWCVISPALPISPKVFKVKTGVSSELDQVIYANSITLTPGTISLRVHDGEIEVHALTAASAEDLKAGAMGRRIRSVAKEA